MVLININEIHLGDNLDLLKEMDENSVHSIVSDFPYNLSFMGKKWDTITNYYDWCYQRAVESLRVLKPGGYALIFGGTRTHHRLVCAFEDAGFEIKDEIQWLYGQGFPKSYNISKGFDKNTKPSLAEQWDGWGTTLKPAHEPIMVAQKPREGTYCNNVEKWGVGGLNIDDSRVKYASDETPEDLARSSQGFTSINEIYHNDKTKYKTSCKSGHNEGRFPANVILDGFAGDIVDQQSGTSISRKGNVRTAPIGNQTRLNNSKETQVNHEYNNNGGASRFFYCPKANTKDKTESRRVENKHPTVKPTELIKYLIRLVTPLNGVSLDICLGSGTHIKACLELTSEGYPVNYIGFEKDEESVNIAKDREKVVREDLRMA